MKSLARWGVVLAAVTLSGASGCETVDLGAPPADVNPCMPGQQWFIDQIWPNFLAEDYGGKHCYDANCHGPNPKGRLSLVVPAEAGAIPLPADWASNYASATSLMSCGDPSDSLLLILPEGVQVHGGGMLIMKDGTEAMLVQQWVTQP